MARDGVRMEHLWDEEFGDLLILRYSERLAELARLAITALVHGCEDAKATSSLVDKRFVESFLLPPRQVVSKIDVLRLAP